MNSNGDHGRGNVFAEVEKVDDRADDHTRSIGVYVCVCVRGITHREHERKEKEYKERQRDEGERERAFEGSKVGGEKIRNREA